jgi:hypothetical protein
VESKSDFLTKLVSKRSEGVITSINDLRDKEFSGVKLSPEEKQAVSNFDRYRITILNAEVEEEIFHQKYRQLQVIANLSDWQEFLKPEFSGL